MPFFGQGKIGDIVDLIDLHPMDWGWRPGNGRYRNTELPGSFCQADANIIKSFLAMFSSAHTLATPALFNSFQNKLTIGS